MHAGDVDGWLADLEARHLSGLSFAEVRRALQALSEDYVSRRDRLGSGRVLAGAGKRAAFALFYGPLHFLLVRKIVRSLQAASPPPREIVDLGCGSGVGGAAWALEADSAPIRGIDRSAWALREAEWTWRRLGLRGRTVRCDLSRAPLPPGFRAILAAFALNELEAGVRETLLERLAVAARNGARVLVVEPVATGPTRWWPDAESIVLAAGGRADVWRFASDLPELQARLSRASGLDHRRLSARSLYLPGEGP
jgi:hypothetical protein